MINLLPEHEQRLVRKQYFLRLVVVGFFLLFTLGLLSTALLIPSYLISRANEQSIITEKETLIQKHEASGIAALEQEVTTINRRLEILKGLETTPVITEEILDPILSTLNDAITVGHIAYRRAGESSIIEIVGVATGRQAIVNLTAALEAVPQFGEVRLPISNLAANQNIEFQMEFSFMPENRT